MLISIASKAYALDMSVGITSWYSWWDYDRGGEKPDIGPSLLYGPAISVKLNDDFNLTFVYLYGAFEHTHSDGTVDKYKRSDSNLALNYIVNNYFTVFANLNYMALGVKKYIQQSTYGPELGIKAVYPISENLSLLATLSGFYLWGKESYDNNDPSINFKDYGINSTLSLAYYISSASTTISLGGRFQYFKADYSNDSESINQKFYGVTLTAMYAFSL